MPEPDWDAIDKVRLARHEQLLKLWQELPVEELLADLVVLAQMAAFKGRQERGPNLKYLECVCRTCGHPASAHVAAAPDSGGRCVMCGQLGCWR